MNNPQVAAFLRSVPVAQQSGWEAFVNSLNSEQLEQFAELSKNLAVKTRAELNGDGLGRGLEGRVVDIKLVQKQHIKIDSDDKPFPAIVYGNHTYSLFRTLHDWSTVEKITSRLRVGYLVTQTPKGWVIWVHEQG